MPQFFKHNIPDDVKVALMSCNCPIEAKFGISVPTKTKLQINVSVSILSLTMKQLYLSRFSPLLAISMTLQYPGSA